jgi:hypothetical protein
MKIFSSGSDRRNAAMVAVLRSVVKVFEIAG